MLKKIASLGALQLLGMVINLVRAKIFAVLLGPTGFGVVATIDQLVLSAVQITNLSLPFTALKFLSRSHSQGEVAFRRSYWAFSKLMGLLAIVATLVALALIPPNLQQLDPQLAPYRLPVTIALLGIPAAMLLIYLTNVLAARREGLPSLLLSVLSGAAVLLAGVAGCLAAGITGIYIGAVSATTALTVAAFVFLWRRRNLPAWGATTGVWAEWARNPEILRVTFFVFFGVSSAAAQLFLVRYLAITQINAAAAGLLQACIAIALAVGAVLGPAQAQYFMPYVNRDIPAAEKFAAAVRFLPRLAFIFSLGALAVLLFPAQALTILFSQEFVAAQAVLAWFVAWQFLYQCANVYQQLLIGLDDAAGYGLVTSVGNILAIALSAALLSRFGLSAIGFGFVVGALVTASLTAWRLRARHGLVIPPSGRLITTYVIAGFAAIAVVGQATTAFSLSGLVARALTAVVFALGLWWVLPPSVREELATAVTTRWRARKR